MASQARVESTLTLEMMTRAYPKGIINNDTRIRPVLEVLVTEHFGRDGIEIKTGSMMNDVTHSWVLISRGVEQHVTVLALDHTQPMHSDETSGGTARLVA